MKIVLLSWYGSGGMIHYTSQLANVLKSHGEIKVIVPEYTDKSYFSEGIPVDTYAIPQAFDFKNTFLQLLNPPLFKRMISDIKKFNPDIIHITNNHPYSIILHIFLKNYTFITTVHNITPNKGEVGSLTRLLLNFTKIITFNKSSKLIVHGKSLKKELMKYVPIEKIEIIPHGNYSFFTQFAEGKIQHQKNNILFFGRILDYKGLEYLIQALPLINDKIPDAIITIAGEGNFEKYYPLIKNRDKFEIFNEYISDKKVAELFSKASVVVLPYIDGSQSGIIAIAYSFGKPVITTNVGSISEVVENGKTGFIIQPKNSQQLAEAAITILRDENLLNSMSERAHIKSKEFSWDAIALKHIAVYNRALIE